MAAAPGQPLTGNSGARRNRPDDSGDWTGLEVDGRYMILERIGEGGMGVVYEAEHIRLKKRVAFKVIHHDLAADEALLARFKREALATGQLDHPHIAAAIDFGELKGGGAYMVMPLVRGRNLQGEVDALGDDGAFPARRAARLGAQIADALSAAHAVGIVHRDLKPDNVLIERRSDGSESAKVLDFGVASLAGRPEGLSVDARPLTQAGTILGTPGYMSPEQASAGDVDHRTDLYALGVILWELVRGERLFDGENITQIFAKQFKTLPPALDLGLAPSGRELSALVARLLSWDKNARPSTAAEVRDTLRQIADMPESRLSGLPKLTLPARMRSLLPHLEKFAPQWRYVATAAGFLLLLVLFVPRNKQQDAVLAPEAEPEAMLAAEEKLERVAQGKPVDKPAEEPVEKLADEDEPPKRVAAVGTATAHRIEATPSVFLKPAETLLGSRNRESRRSVAKRILRSQGVPSYLLLSAELELANRCSEKKEYVEKMRSAGDPRVLPALERMADQPKHGCPPLRLTDCLGCMRRELDQTIGVLQQVGTVPK